MKNLKNLKNLKNREHRKERERERERDIKTKEINRKLLIHLHLRKLRLYPFQDLPVILHRSRSILLNHLRWFPRILIFIIALPLHLIFLGSRLLHPVVNDPVDDVLFLFGFGRNRVSFVLGVVVIKFQLVVSEYGVAIEAFRDVERAVVELIYRENPVWSSPH